MPDFTNVAVAIAYQPAMLYGMLMLLGLFSGGAKGAGGIRFLLLGIAGPLAGWLFAFLAPALCMIGAASLSLLCLLIWLEDNRERAQREGFDAEELEQAQRRVQRAAGDGSAHLTRARLLEKAQRWAEARQAYELAHACSERMLSIHELKQIREQLDHSEAAAKTGAPRCRRHAWEEGSDLIEACLLALAVGLLAWQPRAAANLAAAMLFLLWFRHRAI